jgi:hypothetical protein
MKINKVKTLERIRQRYPSAAACARAYGISTRSLHYALLGQLGAGTRRGRDKIAVALARMDAAGLLVKDEDDPAMLAG